MLPLNHSTEPALSAARQTVDEGHDTAVRWVLTGVGDDQAVPSKVTTAPEASTAAQNEEDAQLMAESGLASTLVGADQAVPVLTATLPDRSARAQKVGVGQDSEEGKP